MRQEQRDTPQQHGAFDPVNAGLISSVGNSTKRLTNRAKREVVERVPMLKVRDAQRRQRRRADHAPSLPRLESREQEHLARLGAEGVSITTLEDLDLPDTAALQSALRGLQARLRTRLAPGLSTIRVTNDEIADDPTIWRWGLNERLLDLAENYLGLPPRYYGADVRCEVADTRTFDVRQWHRDIEDDRLFKVLIWLNDVDIEGGPFQFVAKPVTATASKTLSYVSGFVSDSRLASAADESHWQSAVGPAWTAVFADTAHVFHRAMPPTRHNRFSLTITYSTWYSRKLYPKVPFSAAQQARIRAGLSARQSACLPDVIGN